MIRDNEMPAIAIRDLKRFFEDESSISITEMTG